MPNGEGGGGENARKHRHGAIGHRADEVDREALVQRGPALFHDELACRAHDPRARVPLDHPIRRRIVREWPALRLEARAYHLVWVRRHRRSHFRDGGAQKDRLACDGGLGVALCADRGQEVAESMCLHARNQSLSCS